MENFEDIESEDTVYCDYCDMEVVPDIEEDEDDCVIYSCPECLTILHVDNPNNEFD